LLRPFAYQPMLYFRNGRETLRYSSEIAAEHLIICDTRLAPPARAEPTWKGRVRQRKLSPYRKTQITTYILRVEVTPESNPQSPVLQKV